jgi:ABC-type Fe3+ transport system permease subunit
MNRAQLTFYFAFSLFIGLSIGVVGMLLWIKRVWSRIRKSAERQGPANVGGIAVMSLFYASPGLLFFVACGVPAIYFSHLLKQQSYCVEVVRTNRGITQDHADLKERCGYFDMNELFAAARGRP